MSRFVKGLIIALGVIGVLAVLVWIGWTWFTRQAIPKTSGRISVVGLSEPVEVVRDEYGVAHIYATNPRDLFFAQGYTHAQERFWQMEFQRRTASGRLSEIFGEATLPIDRHLRHLNFRGVTEQSYQMLDPETKEVVDAYTAGVNAYIRERSPARLGLEFALLGLQGVDFEIEEWAPADSMIWAEMMIYDQADVPGPELKNIDLMAGFGVKAYNELNPPYREDRPTIIQTSDLPPSVKKTAETLEEQFNQDELAYLMKISQAFSDGFRPAELVALGFGQGGASNSFVVHGSKTTTGKPILANDPHMAVNTPALWYEIGMHCVEKSPDCIYDFRGFSLPGVPGILIGHNDQIAWGLTNASFDAEDVFIERINPDNPNQYEVNGKWVDMEVRWEEIKVHGQDDPVVILVRKTRNGLIITDDMGNDRPYSYDDQGPELYALSYAWPALEPVRSAQAVIMVNRAQNWDEFNQALSYFDAGKQNWIYADVKGNIGYVMPGKVPIRAKGDGTLPVPGWNDEYRWTGFIPFDKAPRVLNPKQGFIATANNLQIRAEDYLYLISMDHDRGQRAQRITDLLANDQDKVTIEDMIATQTDNQTVQGLELISYLRGITFEDATVSAWRDMLVGWDGQMTMDSPQAALYAIFWRQLNQALFNDKLPEDLWPSGGTVTEDTVHFLLEDPENKWWDNRSSVDILETRDNTLRRTFEMAVAEGQELLGERFDSWRWGDLHQIYYQHATLGKSGISFIENIFNRGPFPVNGSETVVQKTCWSVKRDFSVYCIPALRQIVDLSNLSNSLMVHSLGQSGHPMSPLYDNMIELWRNFEYHPSNWLRAEAEAGRHQTLTLNPR